MNEGKVINEEIQKFKDKYIRATIEDTAATIAGAWRKKKRTEIEITKARESLKKAGSQGLEALALLMDHVDPAVRLWAASDCIFLNIEREHALGVLKGLLHIEPIIGTHAEIALEEAQRTEK
jgi:hypothetical protein